MLYGFIAIKKEVMRMVIKRNWIKIARAIIFFGIAIVFATIKLYHISIVVPDPFTQEIEALTNPFYLMALWDLVFVATKSWLLVGLFSLLGILEVLEMIKHE